MSLKAEWIYEADRFNIVDLFNISFIMVWKEDKNLSFLIVRFSAT